jgi:hypothetical protein
VLPDIAARPFVTMRPRESDSDDVGAKAMLQPARSAICSTMSFGYVPVCVAHTKEYRALTFKGLGKLPERVPPLSIWETDAIATNGTPRCGGRSMRFVSGAIADWRVT